VLKTFGSDTPMKRINADVESVSAYSCLSRATKKALSLKNKKPVVWGVNKYGQEVKEHDKLECGNGFDKWFTHVLFDTERNCWHREQDYYHSRVVGSYNKNINK
jgi:hypothetical protein